MWSDLNFLLSSKVERVKILALLQYHWRSFFVLPAEPNTKSRLRFRRQNVSISKPLLFLIILVASIESKASTTLNTTANGRKALLVSLVLEKATAIIGQVLVVIIQLLFEAPQLAVRGVVVDALF